MGADSGAEASRMSLFKGPPHRTFPFLTSGSCCLNIHKGFVRYFRLKSFWVVAETSF